MGGAPDHDDAPGRPDADADLDLPREPAGDPGSDLEDPVFGGDREPVPFDAGGDIATRVAHAKRRHGAAGAALAAGMLGVDQIVNGRKPREEAPIVVAANSDPLDIDTDGISLSLADADVVAPALPRTEPRTSPTAGKRRRWR